MVLKTLVISHARQNKVTGLVGSLKAKEDKMRNAYGYLHNTLLLKTAGHVNSVYRLPK
jgi:hypothetical protein